VTAGPTPARTSSTPAPPLLLLHDTVATGTTSGAAAVVSAGLGLSSLTGTGLGDMMRSRQEIIGQIEASVGGGAGVDQIDTFYGAPGTRPRCSTASSRCWPSSPAACCWPRTPGGPISRRG
jgi:hypothetical protein